MSKAQDWFRDQKWGLFTHYLYGTVNLPSSSRNMGRGETSWDECVSELDTEKLAEAVASTGARYLFFTLMQGEKYMCAPNETFDRITGYQSGEACATRDLVNDLYDSLHRRGVSLCLYYTGDGPYKDAAQAGPRMGYVEPRQDGVTPQFVANWSDVLREYAIRYGKKVKAWWLDGFYTYFRYTEKTLKPFYTAIKAGNADALVAFNNGVKQRVSYYTRLDDFTCGEMNDFVDVPDERFINGVQWHTLAPLGLSRDGREWGSWCRPGCKRDAAYMRDYIRRVNDCGGVVTVDVCLNRDGSLDPQQLELLQTLNI